MTTIDDVFRSAVERYQEMGYTVDPVPSPTDVPEPLRNRGAVAWFVGRKNGRNVLVEVFRRDQLVALDWPSIPGWNLETVLPPPPPTEPVYYGLEPTPETARRLLDELDTLPRAAVHARFLLAWAAADAVFRVRAAFDRASSLDGVTTAGVLGELASEGDLMPADHLRLQASNKTRYALVQGSITDPITAADAEFVARTARDLLAAEPARAAG